MSKVVWQLEHSVEADVSPAFAWSYWTDVTHWDDPPARFALDGPFADGARGTTSMPGREPLPWTIRDVRPGQSYVIETQLGGATLRCTWRFDPTLDGKTRLTQRLELSGDDAAALVADVEAGFGPGLPDGMKRIAGLLAQAEKGQPSQGKAPSR